MTRSNPIPPGQLTEQGIEALRSGNKAAARYLFIQALSLNSQDEKAWLWLSGAVDTDSERKYCLQQVLNLNPQHEAARRGLKGLPTDLQAQSPLTAPSAGTPSPTPTATPPVPPGIASLSDRPISQPMASLATASSQSTTSPQMATKKPWYLSSGCLILAFIFVMPLWAVLILMDRRQRLTVKILAAVMGLASVWIAGSALSGSGQTTRRAESQGAAERTIATPQPQAEAVTPTISTSPTPIEAQATTAVSDTPKDQAQVDVPSATATVADSGTVEGYMGGLFLISDFLRKQFTNLDDQLAVALSGDLRGVPSIVEQAEAIKQMISLTEPVKIPPSLEDYHKGVRTTLNACDHSADLIIRFLSVNGTVTDFEEFVGSRNNCVEGLDQIIADTEEYSPQNR